MRRILGFGVLAVVGLSCAVAAFGAEGSPDPVDAMIEATFKVKNKDQAGTCFMVAPPAKVDWAPDIAVLVTAAHTFENTSDPDFSVIMRAGGEENEFTRKEVPIKVRSEGKPLWTSMAGLDVAVMQFQVPTGVVCRPIPFEQLAGREAFAQRKIRAASRAWVFCFPAQLEANEAGFPVVRNATVASVPLGGENNHTFLADFSTFGGDSGAPLMIVDRSGPVERPLIAGLITGMQRQTDKTSLPFEELTVHTPMGLAIIIRSDDVRRVVEKLVEVKK